ncbi:CoA ester lyase [Vineibacter terrae]|uniref:HpcH/HpaI aldolase/citrate lyase family protein n=1 Tax=Vineibacter terrae TaxID=2586908 RepID=UPI002E345D24|nr:CoA ester lyase [Vineibacter terrae]HEX2886486.1 CoA ester lyase [Vineibacter terrae]
MEYWSVSFYCRLIRPYFFAIKAAALAARHAEERRRGAMSGQEGQTMRPIRSLLICTTTIARHVESALASDADAVMLDLETSIAEGEKAAARAAAAAVLHRRHKPDIFVRINEIDGRHVFDDLIALCRGRLRGLVLPQAEDPRQIVVLDWILSRLEEKHGLEGPPIEILPLVESARGVENARDLLAASPRVRQATFGVADYCQDTHIQVADDESELAYIRGRLVHASRASGRESPIDTVWLDLADAQGLDASLQRSRRLGFFGKLCIHPRQAIQANAAFSPSAEEVARASRIVDAFEAAMADNVAAIRVDGRLVDLPIVRSAQRIVALSKDLARRAAE